MKNPRFASAGSLVIGGEAGGSRPRSALRGAYRPLSCIRGCRNDPVWPATMLRFADGERVSFIARQRRNDTAEGTRKIRLLLGPSVLLGAFGARRALMLSR